MRESTRPVSRLATVTVTFQPDMQMLSEQLRALPEDSVKIVVDNASEEVLKVQIRRLVGSVPHAVILENTSNEGLAAALNRGVRALSEWAPQATDVLLLDQDSLPMRDSVQTLLDALVGLRGRGERVGCVGPILLDPDTGLEHGFHQATRWRWRRVHPVFGARDLVHCSNINGSGTLVSVELYLDMGGLDESLFIDHVDTEWSFRIAAAGYGLWGVPGAVFEHRMGQAGARYWLFGWRVWPLRSPHRMYFLYRNAVVLMKRDYVPNVWKFWAVVKLLVTAMVVTVLGPRRRAQFERMREGVRAGIRSSHSRGRA